MTEILVTGASGFIGRYLCAELESRGNAVRRAVRRALPDGTSGVSFSVGDFCGLTDWTEALYRTDIVVHLAARAHVLRDEASHPLAEFRRVNVDGTMNLARQAHVAGVRRLVFVRSIGVNGAETLGRPFTAEDVPSPHSPYAISKFEAETELREFARGAGMEVVIVRPPMVLGPEAPGNLGRLVRYLGLGMPLPLGAIKNKRSLVSVDNLVDLISLCLTHDSAPGNTFLVSDGEDISTTELLRRLSNAMGRRPWLLPVPTSVLRGMAVLLGKGALAAQICGSLQVDIEKTRRVLSWTPPLSLDEGIRRSVADRPHV